MNKENILKFNIKPIIIALICLSVAILLLIIIPYTPLRLTVAFGCIPWILVFLIIFIVNKIRSNSALNRYDINEVQKELETAFKEEGINDVYFTDNYIVSNNKIISITKYSDIVWVYKNQPTGRAKDKAMFSLAYKFGGYPITGHLKNGKVVVIAVVKTNKEANVIFESIFRKNEGVLLGYDSHQEAKFKQKYPQLYKKQRNKKIILTITVLIICYLLIRFVEKF